MKGIIYSEKEQGLWDGKAGSHAPVISVDGRKVSVETKHGMDPDHFIVRHTLVLQDGSLLGGKTFKPGDTAKSEYELPEGYKGKISATSYCNMHDLWLSEAEIA